MKPEDNLNDRVIRIETIMEYVQKNVDKIVRTLDTMKEAYILKTDFDKLETRVDTIDNKVNNLALKVAGISATVSIVIAVISIVIERTLK
jgi:hypothetical protein